MGKMFFPDEEDSRKRWSIDKIPWCVLIVINVLGILLNNVSSTNFNCL